MATAKVPKIKPAPLPTVLREMRAAKPKAKPPKRKGRFTGVAPNFRDVT